ncbi:hypothetical protein TNCV_1947031 [Trichonephila clavipes]|nr:hypothetical protein TNCV_1947031 [Trichonephila clavipes]
MTLKTVKKIPKADLDDSQIKVRQLASIVHISKSEVYRILSEILDMRKLCAKWMPCLLTLEHTQCHEDVSTRDCNTRPKVQYGIRYFLDFNTGSKNFRKKKETSFTVVVYDV